ncbi:MAG: hypothetical protein KGL39_42990 [Patescibacteria group bacterium]|nr:hypothetical protein [Patescibacteria group bacterium]
MKTDKKTDKSTRVVHLWDEGRRVALEVRRGRKYTHAIIMSSDGLRIHKFPLAVVMDEMDYPLRRAVRMFREASKDFGITKAAKAALRTLMS